MAGSEKLDPDERALFRAAVQDVRPLRSPQPAQNAAALRRRRAVAAARFARAERAAVLEESLQAPAPEVDTGEALSYRRPGISESVLRKLRRGEYRLDAQIDLHGLTVVEAEAALRAFLRHALARNAACVRVVHGKGLRSGKAGPVLKNMVNRLLPRLDAVLAYTGARQVDGGSGATLVLLARQG
jgi:DNA-nicking Smr family endonuclease